MYTVNWDSFQYSRKQFGIWRIAFGIYLLIYDVKVFPFLTELFSNAGPFGDKDGLPAETFFPDFLLQFDGAQTVNTLFGIVIVATVLFTFGIYRRSSAAVLWLLTAWFYNRNPYSDSPEYAFVNWLIFACIFIPPGESFSFPKISLDRQSNWKMPPIFYWGAWIVLGVGYFYAGASKFRNGDSSWMDGTALYYVLATDNARLEWYGKFFDHFPKFVFILSTYGALVLQTFAIVFIYFRRLRPWWWLAATGVHVSLLFFVNLGQLTLGMIFFHLFLFDLRWFESIRNFSCMVRTKGSSKTVISAQ